MFGFSFWNSGDRRYFMNSTSHDAAVIGGSVPVTGFHSVMLRLERTILAMKIKQGARLHESGRSIP